jgi:hypothetical protein
VAKMKLRPEMAGFVRFCGDARERAGLPHGSGERSFEGSPAASF